MSPSDAADIVHRPVGAGCGVRRSRAMLSHSFFGRQATTLRGLTDIVFGTFCGTGTCQAFRSCQGKNQKTGSYGASRSAEGCQGQKGKNENCDAHACYPASYTRYKPGLGVGRMCQFCHVENDGATLFSPRSYFHLGLWFAVAVA